MTTITKDGRVFALVNTTNGVDVPAGHAIITANLRETKSSNIPAKLKHRNVVIPEFSLPQVEDKFRSVLLDKFYSLAKAYLEVTMEETNRMAREIPLDAFSVDSLLSFFGRVATSNRATSESVAAWFDASATGAYIKEKTADRPAVGKKYRDAFIKTASPNHGLHPNDCVKYLAALQEADRESSMYDYLATKWQATIEKASREVEDL